MNAFSSFPSVGVFVLHTLPFKTLALSREEANRDRSLGRSFTIIFLRLQASHYSYPRISAATAFRKVPGTMACYYAENASLESCDQKGHCRIWMLGKRASPKERFCCSSCSEWLQSEGHARPYTAWSVVDSPWPVHTLDASVVVLPGSGIEESHDACYYAANSNMSGCKQAGVQRMWMTGKNASPKNRLCCIPCATRLREEHHAEVIESVCIAPPVVLLKPSDDDMPR